MSLVSETAVGNKVLFRNKKNKCQYLNQVKNMVQRQQHQRKLDVEFIFRSYSSYSSSFLKSETQKCE